MKKIWRLFGLSATYCVALAAMLTACKDEIYRTVGGNRVAARFSSLVADGTRLDDTSWESGDQIGVYAYDSEGVLADATNDNARFVINPENNSCSVANEDSIVWLQKGETYGIVAYYPFSPTFSSVDNPSVPTVFVQNISTIAVGDKPGTEEQTDPIPNYIILDWSDQSDLASLDLLWCKQDGVSADDPDVTLSLAHQFCRVQLNITIDTELSSLTADSLAGMKVLLAGKNFPAFFNLQSGEMSFGSMLSDSIAFNIQRQEGATTAVASAIIVPDTENSNTEGRTITVQLPADNDRKYVIEIPDEIVFQSGKLYTWNVTFNTGADLSTNSFYVSATGLDSNDGKRDSPLATIAAAVALMNDPDADYTIFIDGKLTGSNSIGSALTSAAAKTVTIMGANGLDATSRIPKDTLDGNESGSVFEIDTEVPVAFSNIMLTNGSAEMGGGVFINEGASVILADGTVVTRNTATASGGGIYIAFGASLYMTGGEISNNTAEDGSGGGIYAVDCQIRISENSVISNNKALGSGDGGGICLEGYNSSSLTLSDNVEISYNETDGSGGGIAVPQSATVKMYDNVTINDNTAGTESDQQGDNVGGGVCLGGDSDFGGASFYMWGGTISGNKVLYSGGEWNNAVCMWGTSSRHSTFAMGGSAVVASDNSIYLGTAPLDIIGPLTGTSPVATLESNSWTNGMQAIEMGTILDDATGVYEEVTTTTVADEYQKFAIWGDKGFLTNEGKYVGYADIQGAVQQILDARENTTITLSGYMTNDSIEIDGVTNTPFGHISTALKSLYADYGTEVMITLDMAGVTGLTEIPAKAFFDTGSRLSNLGGIALPNGVTSIGNQAFYNCAGLTSFEIPSGVTSIGTYAFFGCSGLTGIEIPDGVTSIGEYAFSGCYGLMSITIPNGVTSIAERLFSTCSGLKNVTIPSSVTSIGSMAFWGCRMLNSIEIPSSVTSIDDGAFYNCSGLTNIEIPSNVTSIGSSVFYGCTGLTNIEIPSNVTSIGSMAYYGCTGLTNIEIPNSVTSIGNQAFQGCKGLTSIEIPSSVTSISDGMFYECTGLTSIEIPSSVTSIGSDAFNGCSVLTSIVIPRSVTSIGSVFWRCDALTTVYYAGTEDDREAMTIDDTVITGSGVTWYYNYDGHPFVDLGLPNGLLWATCNVGASKPEGYGNYYAWGETTGYDEGKTSFSWSTYTLCNGSLSTMTKYCTNSSYGTVDNIATLELADDAANANWGGDWRMPTYAEFQELLDNCSSEWVTDYNGTGVAGRLFTSNNNGNTLFLPAAGDRYDASLHFAGTNGYYWSSSLYSDDQNRARLLDFGSGYVYAYYGNRYDGLSVRAVLAP
ncbi:MAG: leucine-rich repeat protein [Bacteroidales bacterium]|nr:leucine-rich repeat protein [Bacteroidales bacterium]